MMKEELVGGWIKLRLTLFLGSERQIKKVHMNKLNQPLESPHLKTNCIHIQGLKIPLVLPPWQVVLHAG